MTFYTDLKTEALRYDVVFSDFKSFCAEKARGWDSLQHKLGSLWKDRLSEYLKRDGRGMQIDLEECLAEMEEDTENGQK